MSYVTEREGQRAVYYTSSQSLYHRFMYIPKTMIQKYMPSVDYNLCLKRVDTTE